jgi:DNA polymerase alpha subunit A
MVNTNQLDMAAVREIGKTIRKEVNKRYSILEIELDGIFKNMLLLKKKKYACLTVVERPDGAMSVIKEIKGLDMVRRDWSQLSKDVGDFCLNEILSNKSRDEVVANIHDHLRRVKEAVMANTMPLEKYIIYKGLTKAPNEYPDKNNQPHVCVALKMIADGKTVRVGDHIPYIICKSEEKGVALRAQHPDTIEKSNGALVVDSMWYLSNQVHPPTARLLDPLEETDAAHIADCLGLDSRRFHAQSKGDDVNDDENTVPEEDDEERFKGCDRLVVPGGDGKGDLVVEGVFRLGASKAPGGSDEAKENGAGEAGEGVTVGELLDRTNAADPQPGLVRLSNALELAIRRHVDRYYKSQAQSFSVKGDEEDAKDGAYSARDLYTQLCYFQSLFDVERARRKDKAATKAKSDGNPEVVAAERVVSNHAESVCRQVHSHLEQVLRRNAYHYVSLKRLFTFAFSTQKV